MIRIQTAAWVLALATPLALMGGCANGDPSEGYTTATQYRTDVRSVSVPIFTRAADEFRRDIEIRLTEAVKKQIALESGYRVVDQARADTVLIGRLNWVKKRPMSINTASGRAREYLVQLSVDLLWKDLRGDGRILMEREDFRVKAEYIPTGPFFEDFFMGSEDAVNRMAQRIVEQLARPW